MNDSIPEPSPSTIAQPGIELKKNIRSLTKEPELHEKNGHLLVNYKLLWHFKEGGSALDCGGLKVGQNVGFMWTTRTEFAGNILTSARTPGVLPRDRSPTNDTLPSPFAFDSTLLAWDSSLAFSRGIINYLWKIEENLQVSSPRLFFAQQSHGRRSKLRFLTMT
ncbi:hypothetical protein ARMSODRAFT_971946 [Armillaria solidipes]|uniref:Uncharacterized protein n=1 Tax=Armillaria solidipes TaxID=1076256 RepID=A0A2H3C2Q9_9AGAR|nr:hypothetical protein ARMSODRAFT_971946 [Armillaria solidipes]